MEKVFIDQVLYYYEAERKNNKPVIVTLCITDSSGAIYSRFEPGSVKLSPLMWPQSITELPQIEELTGQGNDGYYGLRIYPGNNEVWRKGIYILGFSFVNATHQGAGLVKLTF